MCEVGCGDVGVGDVFVVVDDGIVVAEVEIDDGVAAGKEGDLIGGIAVGRIGDNFGLA